MLSTDSTPHERLRNEDSGRVRPVAPRNTHQCHSPWHRGIATPRDHPHPHPSPLPNEEEGQAVEDGHAVRLGWERPIESTSLAQREGDVPPETQSGELGAHDERKWVGTARKVGRRDAILTTDRFFDAKSSPREPGILDQFALSRRTTPQIGQPMRPQACGDFNRRLSLPRKYVLAIARRLVHAATDRFVSGSMGSKRRTMFAPHMRSRVRAILLKRSPVLRYHTPHEDSTARTEH